MHVRITDCEGFCKKLFFQQFDQGRLGAGKRKRLLYLLPFLPLIRGGVVGTGGADKDIFGAVG